MRSLIVAAVAVAASALPAATDIFNHEAVIRSVRANGAPWESGVNEKFVNATYGQIRALMGTKRGEAMVKAQAKLGKWPGKPVPVAALPTSFSVVEAWPACANVTGHIRDQSACGSCWAFGSTEAFNDRLCISKGVTKLLSPGDTNACCNFLNGCLGSSGCDGGVPDEAWSYFTSVGVVSGDDYEQTFNGGSCYPYPFPWCSHHEQGKYPMCPTNEYNTPNCPSSCPDTTYGKSWSSDKIKAATAYNLNTVADAMADLVAHGSITTSFDVYEDFLTYKSGVYTYQTGQLLGGHSVKIVGYGTTSDGTDYWVINNSWNQYWGLNGTFWIKRGVDECGIEDDLVTGTV